MIMPHEGRPGNDSSAASTVHDCLALGLEPVVVIPAGEPGADGHVRDYPVRADAYDLLYGDLLLNRAAIAAGMRPARRPRPDDAAPVVRRELRRVAAGLR